MRRSLFVKDKTVEAKQRGRGTQRAKAPPPGTFRPALPSDSQQVLLVFAIAARAACAEPNALEPIQRVLALIVERLIAPERHAAEECGRMWSLFARVAQLPKDTLRREAARALCRDLDALGQRLDLPPLAEWAELPEGIDEPSPVTLQLAAAPEPEVASAALGLAEAQAQAQQLAAAKQLDPSSAAKLLGEMEAEARQGLFTTMVGKGVLSRADASLLIRYLLKAGPLGRDDTMLREVLERLGQFLAHGSVR